MNIYIDGGLECGWRSREESRKQDLILREIVEILVNFVPFLRKPQARAELLYSPQFPSHWYCCPLSMVLNYIPFYIAVHHPSLNNNFWTPSHQLRGIFLLTLAYFMTQGCKTLPDALVDQKIYFLFQYWQLIYIYKTISGLNQTCRWVFYDRWQPRCIGEDKMRCSRSFKVL